MILERRDSIFARIFERVVINPLTGCWEWQGSDSGTGRGGGYGRISIDGCTAAVHIVVFTHFFGYIPGKKQVDHTCNNRICCNPEHLELVSHKVNQKRKVQRAKEKIECLECN